MLGREQSRCFAELYGGRSETRIQRNQVKAENPWIPVIGQVYIGDVWNLSQSRSSLLRRATFSKLPHRQHNAGAEASRSGWESIRSIRPLTRTGGQNGSALRCPARQIRVARLLHVKSKNVLRSAMV